MTQTNKYYAVAVHSIINFPLNYCMTYSIALLPDLDDGIHLLSLTRVVENGCLYRLLSIAKPAHDKVSFMIFPLLDTAFFRIYVFVYLAG